MAHLVSRTSLPVTGIPGDGFLGDFIVKRGFEGPQILIQWTPPDDVILDEQLLIRKLGSWPENIDDGHVLVHEITPFTVAYYSDREVDPGVVMYYALFGRQILTGNWSTARRMRDKTFAIQTGYFCDKVWELFPRLYHTADGEQ